MSSQPRPPAWDHSTADVSRSPLTEEGSRLVPALTIASHPRAHRVGERLLLEALASGRPMRVSRNEPDFMRPEGALGMHLADPFLSRKPLVLAPAAEGGIRLEPGEGSRVAVGGEVLREPWEFSAAEVAAGVPLELAGRVLLVLHLADASAREAEDALGMVGGSVGLQRVRQHITRVADLHVPVLVRGETGSGKELIAQAIHRHSTRRDKPFVSVNLGAIPRELAAAELFGARKGAFTGAVRDQPGFFQAAHEGTLFLDEVGEAPPEVQVMLLRVLETGQLYPVGERTPIAVDVRLVAATDANLEQQIQEGRFKAPLLHRLSGYSIRVPPLRERREDIGLLFHHFARAELEALGEAWRLTPEAPTAEPWLPSALAARLVGHRWSGNIRELRNVARQLVIGSRGQPCLRLDAQLEQELALTKGALPGRPAHAPPAVEAPAAPRRKPSEISEEELLAALQRNDWDFQAAADQLRIHRSSIYDLIEKSPHLRTAGDLSPEEITRCFHECQGDLDAMTRRLQVSKRALGRRVKELGLG
ncbi:sigma-54-dependent Fis family transcriptional regulator [Pyxidicoccus fallax]|uniref:Sigma-54-dependent Fis family transcriptional regulator n=1 Tax=Pyxidicoccus fallax TaxID=394095 RepID=A0A848LXH1_9BACT|nr:sigma-54-dependent Fis family transcriptional regulator [Pyxidicoccus fallax]NPC85203.1 sigma-54-dependent Fis family transcriptional regulator [Pyxidicoccus fallax]